MTIKSIDSYDSSVLWNMAKIAEEKNLIKDKSNITKIASSIKKEAELTKDVVANILVFASQLRKNNFNDYADLIENKILNYKKAEHLYKTHKEDMNDLLEFAHPEGSPKMGDAKDNMGEVEDLLDQHRKILEVVNKYPKLSKSADQKIPQEALDKLKEGKSNIDNRSKFIGTMFMSACEKITTSSFEAVKKDVETNFSSSYNNLDSKADNIFNAANTSLTKFSKNPNPVNGFTTLKQELGNLTKLSEKAIREFLTNVYFSINLLKKVGAFTEEHEKNIKEVIENLISKTNMCFTDVLDIIEKYFTDVQKNPYNDVKDIDIQQLKTSANYNLINQCFIALADNNLWMTFPNNIFDDSNVLNLIKQIKSILVNSFKYAKDRISHSKYILSTEVLDKDTYKDIWFGLVGLNKLESDFNSKINEILSYNEDELQTKVLDEGFYKWATINSFIKYNIIFLNSSIKKVDASEIDNDLKEKINNELQQAVNVLNNSFNSYQVLLKKGKGRVNDKDLVKEHIEQLLQSGLPLTDQQKAYYEAELKKLDPKVQKQEAQNKAEKKQAEDREEAQFEINNMEYALNKLYKKIKANPGNMELREQYKNLYNIYEKIKANPGNMELREQYKNLYNKYNKLKGNG